MSNDPNVNEVLEQLLDSSANSEDVLRACPDLIPAVRAQLERFRAVEAELGALFPARTTQDIVLSRPSVPAELPHVPGYEVRGVLGSGGMGVVYHAWDHRLKRSTALKMLLAGSTASLAQTERFLRGAEAEAALRHANIVQIYDVGNIDGRPYFTMEYVEGGSLAERLNGAPLPAEEAAALLALLADAMQAAHECGVVHRDLKPANVLLTTGGAPKITDFGLARKLDDDHGPTLTGAALGTPCYMAPEQARGIPGAIGPAADIYSLGAILYQMLAGRPPFRAGTAAATVRQVLEDEPVAPSRLNPTVPRDLETICLKCLQKEPHRRYPCAAALAEDLRRFQRGDAISARPDSLVGKLARRMRRRPVFSGTIAGAAVVIAALLGAGIWLSSERIATARRISAERAGADAAGAEDLRELTRALRDSSWRDATAALDRAKVRLRNTSSQSLRRQLDTGTSDLALALRLDSLRLGGTRTAGGWFDQKEIDKQYEDAFRAAGMGTVGEKPEKVVPRIRQSNIRAALITALDFWGTCVRDDVARGDWLLAVARAADGDRSDWRNRARDPKTFASKAALKSVIADAPMSGDSIPLLLALAQKLSAAGENQIPFLQRIQQANLGDFWANLALAEALHDKMRYGESVRYYQAALAIRPQTAAVLNNLGLALVATKQSQEAARYLQLAVSLNDLTDFHLNLALALGALGRYDEAIERIQRVRRIGPKTAFMEMLLADMLVSQGRYAEGADGYREALRLDPRFAAARGKLLATSLRLGRIDDARIAFWQGLEGGRPMFEFLEGYTEYCLFRGDDAEYRRARQALLNAFERTSDARVAELVSRAYLLLPASPSDTARAAALIDRALVAARQHQELAWTHPFFMVTKGLAEYRLGQWDLAISIMERDTADALRPAPGLVAAMAKFRAGKEDAARTALSAAIQSFDWRPEKADQTETWMYHILRREAEAMILRSPGQGLPQVEEPAGWAVVGQGGELHAGLAPF
jgi:serine/threonine-protein kinase